MLSPNPKVTPRNLKKVPIEAKINEIWHSQQVNPPPLYGIDICQSSVFKRGGRPPTSPNFSVLKMYSDKFLW